MSLHLYHSIMYKFPQRKSSIFALKEDLMKWTKRDCGLAGRVSRLITIPPLKRDLLKLKASLENLIPIISMQSILARMQRINIKHHISFGAGWMKIRLHHNMKSQWAHMKKILWLLKNISINRFVHRRGCQLILIHHNFCFEQLSSDNWSTGNSFHTYVYVRQIVTAHIAREECTKGSCFSAFCLFVAVFPLSSFSPSPLSPFWRELSHQSLRWASPMALRYLSPEWSRYKINKNLIFDLSLIRSSKSRSTSPTKKSETAMTQHITTLNHNSFIGYLKTHYQHEARYRRPPRCLRRRLRPHGPCCYQDHFPWILRQAYQRRAWYWCNNRMRRWFVHCWWVVVLRLFVFVYLVICFK